MSGLTASVIRGGISVFPAIMTLLFAVLLQIMVNLYHGYLYLRSSSESSQATLLRIVANVFGILTITAGISLFTFIGWIGMVYVVVIAVLLYFYLLGPKPIVRTKWSVIFTFLFFGPIAVSGTALIQNFTNPDWFPIAVYSVINGLLAVNAHIAVQYFRYEEDRKYGSETLVTAKGGNFTRFVYLGNAVILCLLLVVRPSSVEFVSPWVGVIVGLSLLVSSILVFSMMHNEPRQISNLIRSVTLWQYIVVTLVLMTIVMYSIEKFRINIFHFL